MKKIFTLIIAFMVISLPMTALASYDKSTPQPITLTSHANDNIPNPKPLRAPMRIPVEALYDATFETISIVYDGETAGTVNLYKEGMLLESSNDINTTFQTSGHGFYTIEITTESWTATGSIDL